MSLTINSKIYYIKILIINLKEPCFNKLLVFYQRLMK